MNNFDPYPDWDEITQDHANALLEKLRAQDSARRDFMGDPTPENAQRVLQTVMESTAKADEIVHEIWTVPVMVHVAGPRHEETNPDDDALQQGILQRCQRCKSVLHFWTEGMMVLTPDGPTEMSEDDVGWWNEGTLVAKATSNMGATMYVIENRDLRKHEYECVGFPNME